MAKVGGEAPVRALAGVVGTAAPAGGRRLKVALVRGPIVATSGAINNEAVPSIGLAYLLAFLHRQGHQAELVDAIARGLGRWWPLERYPGYQCQGLSFAEIAEAVDPAVEVVGFSSMFSGEWPVLRDLILFLRARLPHALFVAGGEHATALSEYVLRDCPALDLIVRGEGEYTFSQVLEAVAAGVSWRDLPGVVWLDQEGVCHDTPALYRVRDLENLPWPEWPPGYLEGFWQAQKSYGVLSLRDMPLMVSRGCPYRCAFCSSPHMWTTRYALREVADVIAEIKHYRERFAITAVQLYDLTAIVKKRWAVAFCRALLDEGLELHWSLPSGTRSEALDEETLGLFRQTGCNYLVYAPESASPRTLAAIRKQIDLDQLTQSILIGKRLGLVVRINLIIGFPHETRLDVWRTIVYGLKMAVRGVDDISINIFSPYPGTELFAELQAVGKVRLGDDYFFALTSLNSDYTQARPMTVNERMGARELAAYRLFFMMVCYGLGYLLRPLRVVRTLRAILSQSANATTVFEHRLRDLFKRFRAGGDGR